MQKCAKQLARHLWGLVFFWSSTILALFVADCWHMSRTIKQIALIDARAYLNREMVLHGFSFGILWLLGGAGFWLAAAKLAHLMNLMKKHDAIEEELKTSHTQMKHLMADLVRHEESERKAIALEIHEEIAQSLSAIKMNLEAWLDTDAQASGYGSQVTLAIIERIKADIDLIRRLTKRLSPIMLDDLGIKTVIETLCRETSEACGRSEINVNIDADEAIIPGELKIAIYRVLEDVLAQTTDGCLEGCRTVELNERNGHIVLTVQTTASDAVGCVDKSAWDRQIAATENRAAFFGGAMAVKPGTGNECTLTVRWPLDEDSRQ